MTVWQETRNDRNVQGDGSQAAPNGSYGRADVLGLREDFKIRFPYSPAQADAETMIP